MPNNIITELNFEAQILRDYVTSVVYVRSVFSLSREQVFQADSNM